MSWQEAGPAGWQGASHTPKSGMLVHKRSACVLQARAGGGNFLNLGVLFCIMGTGIPPSLPPSQGVMEMT